MAVSKSLEEQLAALTGKGGNTKKAPAKKKGGRPKKTEAEKIVEKVLKKGPKCNFCGRPATVEVLIAELDGSHVKSVMLCKGCTGKRMNFRKEG